MNHRDDTDVHDLFAAIFEYYILCVFLAYTKAFGTFDHAILLMGPVKAFMPPQGILLIAALVPREWQVPFVD